MPSSEHDPAAFAGPPRWVKVAMIATAAVLLVVLAVLVFGGGEHGPAGHSLGSAEVGTGARG
jgi:hypothetical protein